MQEELLQVYDAEGNVIEPLPRSVVHEKPVKHWHGVVNVWLVNKSGDLMASLRSKTVDGNPGKWQTYFGGHVPAGMTHLEAAAKELNEEVGLNIDLVRINLIDKGKFENEDHLHFYESYAYLFDGQPEDLNFKDGEIVEAKWMSMNEYEQARTEQPEQWCNACNEKNQELIKEWLKTIS